MTESPHHSADQPGDGKAVPPAPSTPPSNGPEAGSSQSEPGTVLTAVMGLPAVAGRIWSGRLVEALSLSQVLPRFGWVSMALAVVAIPLSMTILFGRAGMGLLNLGGTNLLGRLYGRQYFLLDAGAFFQLLLLLIVLTALVIALRILTVWLAFAWAGSKQGFSTVANLLAGVYSTHLLVLPVIVLLALIPGDTVPTFAAGLLWFLWSVSELAATLALYVGVNRQGTFATSPLVPHVVCTVAWVALSGLVVYILLDTIAGLV